ncbi:MAG: RNA-binding protein [Acidobacteriia bacterium]|jgi:RNA recognition motif-containing protein|nr:RNA-binding protein [Terriglobia bacterium]
MKNLFVGNLPFGATEDALRDLFSPFGEVQQVRIMTDRDTGKSRGFAFVEMAQDDDAAKAIAALNGKDLNGRALTINEARPRPERSGGFRPGGGGYGGKRRGSGNNYRGARSPREPRW